MNCACGKRLRWGNKSGKCRDCLNADSEWQSRRAAAAQRAIKANPECLIKAGRTRSATFLAHIPPEHRDEYRRLTGKFKFPAAEATRIILDHIERRAA